MVYRYGEFYSTMKDKITSFARKLVELEIIISSDGNHISSEISHSQKDKNWTLNYTCVCTCTHMCIRIYIYIHILHKIKRTIWEWEGDSQEWGEGAREGNGEWLWPKNILHTWTKYHYKTHHFVQWTYTNKKLEKLKARLTSTRCRCITKVYPEKLSTYMSPLTDLMDYRIAAIEPSMLPQCCA